MDSGRAGAGCGELVAGWERQVRRGCGARHRAEGSPATPSDPKESGAHTDRSDLCGVPARREPQHADARGRSAAVREAGGRGPQLHPRDVRVDARRRGDAAALPQAPLPLHPHRRPAGVEGGRPVRHRAPPPPQRPAQAGARARAARPLRPAALDPPGLGAAALGDPRHRGAPRRPGRAVLQAPPRPRRRRLGDAAAPERADHRPRQARHAGALGRGRRLARHEACAGPQPLRGPDERPPRRARHHRRGRRHAECPGQDPPRGTAQRDVGALPLRAAHALQPEDHRLPTVRRPGLAGRAAARHRQGHRHHAERRRARDVQRRGPRLPARARRAPRGPAGRDGARSASTPSSRTSPPPRAATPSAR